MIYAVTLQSAHSVSRAPVILTKLQASNAPGAGFDLCDGQRRANRSLTSGYQTSGAIAGATNAMLG